jgi:hypothetical protein
MPAKDRYHDTVKRALVKDGWTILDEQYFIGTDARQLWVDLHIGDAAGQHRLLVEVKSFLVGESAVENLANAIGKYQIYEAAIAIRKLQLPLYLAIPIRVYEGIFSEDIVAELTQNIKIRLIRYDLRMRLLCNGYLEGDSSS